MALRRVGLLALASVLLVVGAGAARAQPGPDAGPPPGAGPPPVPEPTFEPPRAITPTEVPYPAGAPAHTEPVVVTVKLVVDVTGAVKRIEPVTPPQPVFDEAVAAAARGFRFEPARYAGEPVPVEINFTHRFLPPLPSPAPTPTPETPVDRGPPLDAVLRGRLVELGTRAPVSGATVAAEMGGRHYTAVADERGRFRIPIPAGTAKVTVHSTAHRTFLQQETVATRQELAVTYLVERERYDPYEIVVVGDERREEVSRVTLRGPEIKQVPGTFGDPFRVIQTLPGVASVMSLLPFPVVRGASPSSTGFLLDGTRVPLLYHLLYGPSVVHPNFIDEVQFYPGGAPVTYGGYTGGIVDGRTGRAKADETLVDVDLNLLQAGGMVRQPVPVIGTATAAFRYGYPGFLLGLATKEVSLSYWDYQFRVDGGNPRNGWTVFAFGARDELKTAAPDADPMDPTPPLEPSLVLGFHRLDLRFHHGRGRYDSTYRVVTGVDRTISAGADISMMVAEPSTRWQWKQDERLTLVAGLEGTLRDVDQGGRGPPSDGPGDDDDVDLGSITDEINRLYGGGALTEALWRPTSRWLIRPGVRGDVWHDGETTKGSVDPRLSGRYKLAVRDLPDVRRDTDESAIWLKSSVGVFHQPPRFVLPVPGLDTMPLRFGLLRSLQSSLGVEVPFQHQMSITAEGFFNYMDPTIFDLAVNQQDLNEAANDTLVPGTTEPMPDDEQEIIDRLLSPQTGRSYGTELLVRRQSQTGLFGWLSYTLSRAERRRDGAWVPYDFDRPHLLNLVAGMRLPRNWDFGARFQYQSGKPTTTTSGYNTARIDGYARIDLRIDKRAVWRNWLLDFYVDVLNLALLPEQVTPGTTLRYVLPTAGVRGRF